MRLQSANELPVPTLIQFSRSTIWELLRPLSTIDLDKWRLRCRAILSNAPIVHRIRVLIVHVGVMACSAPPL